MTASLPPPVYSFSVKDVAEFCWRRGDYRFSDQPIKPTATQGQAAHQFLQNRHKQANERYQAEVPVSGTVTRCNDGEEYDLRVRGRIDSLWQTDHSLTIEEIKTTYYQEAELPEDQLRVHRAQARLYGALRLREHDKDQPNAITEPIKIIVSYWHLANETSYQRIHKEAPESLIAFLDETLATFGQWLDRVHRHRCARQRFLQKLAFPFGNYRTGQKALAGACYHQARDGNALLAHAATGIGKSISTLFGSLKAMADGYGEQIWYLTAKNSGQQAALQAISQLMTHGHDIKCLNLISQQRSCFCLRNADQDEALDTPCQWESGFYDRKPAALNDLFEEPVIDSECLHRVAKQHQLCPNHLAQELLPWVDVVIADFNYLFSFTVRNQGYLDRHQRRINLLIDEAHNLPDRCRGNYSATLTREDIKHTRDTLKAGNHPATHAINTLLKVLRATEEDPEAYPAKLFDAIQLAKLALDTPPEQQATLFAADDGLNLKILLNQWLRLARYCEPGLGESGGHAFSLKKTASTLTLACNNPAVVIEDLSQRCRSRVFFSGSLLPMRYFQVQLCPDAGTLVLPSPFPRERLRILLGPLALGYGEREASLPEALACILTVYNEKPGLYLVCAPSHEFLMEVENRVREMAWDLPLVFQSSESSAAVLPQMTNGIAFVVLGGSFAEGVEWPPGVLKGIIILGNGMPGPTRDQKRLQDYFDHASHAREQEDAPVSGGRGFDYAFLFPGLNRIIQTVGRIQRTDIDAGIVVLLDKRFRQRRYQQHLPEHWRCEVFNNRDELANRCRQFWEMNAQRSQS